MISPVLTVSGFERQHVVDGLSPSDDTPPALVDEDFRRQRPPIIVRGHRRSIGAGVPDGDEIADLEGGQPAVAPDNVSALANLSHRLKQALDGGTRRPR